MTEHRQEASTQVAAMEPRGQGCLLPSQMPKELPVEGNNEDNIEVFPSDTKYKAASCGLKKRIEKLVRYLNEI